MSVNHVPDRHGLAALGWHPDSAESQLCAIVGMIVVAAVILAFVVGIVICVAWGALT